MPRLMSFALTTAQIAAQQKTVTRRLGWRSLRPGQLVWAVERCMGLKAGEKVKRLALLQIVSVRREPLNAIDQADVTLEGYPDLTPAEFVSMFCESMKCKPRQRVQRIEFKYVFPIKADEAS